MDWTKFHDLNAARKHASRPEDVASISWGHDEIKTLHDALKWVPTVVPAKNRHGAAVVEMTWEEWNKLRRAMGLPEHKEPARATRR